MPSSDVSSNLIFRAIIILVNGIVLVIGAS